MQKNGFAINNCVKIDLKKKEKKGYYFPSFILRSAKIKGSIFFQSVCESAILHTAFLYSWADEKDDV